MVFNQPSDTENETNQSAMPSVPSQLVIEVLEALRRYQTDPTPDNFRDYKAKQEQLLKLDNPDRL